VKRLDSKLKIKDGASSASTTLKAELTTAVSNCNSKSRRSKPSHCVSRKMDGEDEILKKIW